ncbi:MAG: type II toxin-antitoxin system HicA family toxin [Bacteroidales bacterium]|nr:type II toxin-antitoxin system HicA family toxin [Bacteroidales bacterium]MBR4637077.1 type II toxin-antitoxin system HicA family toxin [Bacteroidales bacterium]
MKRKVLINHLEANNCEFLNHGKKHDVYINTETKVKTTLPRHADIDEELADAICKQLGIPKKR